MQEDESEGLDSAGSGTKPLNAGSGPSPLGGIHLPGHHLVAVSVGVSMTNSRESGS
jgi:hypothetical protein